MTAWLVARHELRERVRSRPFLIITVLIALLSAGGVVAIDRLPALFEEGPKHLGVVGTDVDALQADLEQSAGSLGVDVEVRRFPDRAAGETALRSGDVDALVAGEHELVFDSEEEPSLTAVVNRAIYVRSLPGILSELGLTYEDVRRLVDPSGATIAVLDPAAAGKAADKNDRIVVAQVATMAIFLALVFYGQAVLTGVVEEKTSRVAEVLLGTVRPEQLLAGKVLGIVGAAAIQMAVGASAAIAALVVVGAARMPSVALDVAVVSCAFFVLGLLSYSFLYAATGATVSRQSEAESAQMPLSLALIVPYFLSLTVLADSPDGAFGRVLSLLPPTAPMAMPARVAMGDPNPAEIVASLVLMVPWLLAVIWIGGRLYTGAILHSGTRLGLLATWRGGREAVGD
jgi:ABC-2 type transport system permease protein